MGDHLDNLAQARRHYQRALALYTDLGRPEADQIRAEGEVLHLLDFTPDCDAPSRAGFSEEALAADRRRLASEQQSDGGWDVTYDTFSPAADLEWRGYATVQAVTVLRGGRL